MANTLFTKFKSFYPATRNTPGKFTATFVCQSMAPLMIAVVDVTPDEEPSPFTADVRFDEQAGDFGVAADQRIPLVFWDQVLQNEYKFPPPFTGPVGFTFIPTSAQSRTNAKVFVTVELTSMAILHTIAIVAQQRFAGVL